MPLYCDPNFRALPPGLALIFENSAEDSFFDLPQWYDIFARLALPLGSDIRVYTHEHRASRSALLVYGAKMAKRRCLTSLANVYSVEHNVISSPEGNLSQGVANILAEITADRPHWDCLHLTELDPGARAYEALLQGLQEAGFLVECTPGAATWFEITAGMTFEDYVAQRPSELRNTWRRKRRSIAAAGKLTAVFFSDDRNIDRAIADYQNVYAASWKPPENFPDFVPALIRLAAQLQALRMGIYYLDGAPVAAQFWIVWRHRAIIYKLAHDRRLDKLSLGTLLTMEMTKNVLEQDHPNEINLGRGDDPYKRLWLPKRRQRWGIMAANPRTIPGLAFGIRRAAAKLYHRLRGEPITPGLPDFLHKVGCHQD